MCVSGFANCINDYTPTHLTARVHPNLCSPPNPCTQQTHSTNTRNKLTQPVVLFYPIHPNSFPAEPTCFRVLFAPAEALAEGSKISLAGRQVPKPRCLSPTAHSLDVRIAGCQVPKPKYLNPVAISLEIRIAGCQPSCLDLPRLAPVPLGALRVPEKQALGGEVVTPA